MSKSRSAYGRRLCKYRSAIQEYGTFFDGFPWTVYATATFRQPRSWEHAKRTFNVFARMVEQALGRAAFVSTVAVLERADSGLGQSSERFHWHFLMTAPPKFQKDLLRVVRTIWSDRYGNIHAKPYCQGGGAAYYLAKTACREDFDFVERNLKRLESRCPRDLFAAQQSSPAVPEHVRSALRADTLVLRPNGQLFPDRQIAHSLETTRALAGHHPTPHSNGGALPLQHGTGRIHSASGLKSTTAHAPNHQTSAPATIRHQSKCAGSLPASFSFLPPTTDLAQDLEITGTRNRSTPQLPNSNDLSHFPAEPVHSQKPPQSHRVPTTRPTPPITPPVTAWPLAPRPSRTPTAFSFLPPNDLQRRPLLHVAIPSRFRTQEAARSARANALACRDLRLQIGLLLLCAIRQHRAPESVCHWVEGLRRVIACAPT